MRSRFGKFVFVGCVGTGVQLAVLTLLTQWAHFSLVPATLASVEAAIIQNFLWHVRYTWPDRNRANQVARLLRFHLANGLVSLAGNAFLMHILVTRLRVPHLLSALSAITICGLANFGLAEGWVFSKNSVHSLR